MKPKSRLSSLTYSSIKKLLQYFSRLLFNFWLYVLQYRQPLLYYFLKGKLYIITAVDLWLAASSRRILSFSASSLFRGFTFSSVSFPPFGKYLILITFLDKLASFNPIRNLPSLIHLYCPYHLFRRSLGNLYKNTKL